jgi:hypothetical protein
MDEISYRIAELRKSLASTVCLIEDLEENQSVDIFNMADFNSKVDLRPSWMLNGNNRSHKPHVDSVLHPEQRDRGIPRGIPTISSEQLKSVELRKVENKFSTDMNSSRARESNSVKQIIEKPSLPQPEIDVFRYQTHSSKGSAIENTIPPPPPPPQLQNIDSPRQENDFSSFQRPVRSNTFPTTEVVEVDSPPVTLGAADAVLTKLLGEMTNLKIQLDQERLKNNNVATQQEDKPPTYKSKDDARMSDCATVIQRRDEVRLPVDINTEFNKKELLDIPGVKGWLDQLVDEKFERVSRLDAQDRAEPGFDVEMKHRSRSRSKEKKRRNSRGNEESRDSSRNSRTSRKPYNFQNNSFDSVKSATRSIRSIMFKNTEEEEVYSEVDEDDIANPNDGDVGLVDNVSTKFMIHGPFMDKELNVFHAICAEYQAAARISFAKRTRFSRTNPAHERVYALLGSNRRSGWANINSWNKAVNDLQVLDFIFRKVIRSESKKIRKPVMELEHFSEGSTLNSHRFYSIMHAVFKKRAHLVKVLNVDVDRFTDIK